VVKLFSLKIQIVKPETFTPVTFVVGIISFRIVNQKESIICSFEEKVTNPEIQIAIDINPFVIIWQVFKNHPERNINQNISNSAAVSEKVTIVKIVPVMIVYVDYWFNHKPADYMPVIVVVIIMFVVKVRIRIVIAVIIFPTAVVPPVIFPISFPMFIVFVIIISTIMVIVSPVVRTIFRQPILVATTVFPADSVSNIVGVMIVPFCIIY
jgi:hypothetical protein